MMLQSNTVRIAASLAMLVALSSGASAGGHVAKRHASNAAAGRIIVHFAPGVSRSAERGLLTRAGIRLVRNLPPLHAAIGVAPAGGGSGMLLFLRHARGVRSVQMDGLVSALDQGMSAAETASASWQLARTDVPLAWQVTQGDPSVVVAVVDSGVQADHPGLGGRVLPGWDLVNGDDNAADDYGHGTAIAGIIGSACPRCSILPVKVLGPYGAGDWGTVGAGIVWAADHGAQVINVSFGAPRALDIVAGAVSYAISKGAIVVAAAGNDGKNEPFFPASYPGVVSVAGVDANDSRYSWSNFGSWVTVAAPGCTSTTWIDSGYAPDFCGTSAAAPFVTGLAGLARAFRPDLSSGEFAADLSSSAVPMPDPSVAASGRVDANRLLNALGAPSGPPVPTSMPSLATVPVVGRAVVAAHGAWQSAQSFTYHWQRLQDGRSWEDVGSGMTYTPRVTDRGYRLRIVVFATNGRGSVTAASVPSTPVAMARRVVHHARAKNAHRARAKNAHRVGLKTRLAHRQHG